MFQMNNCAKLFWNPCINVQVMGKKSSIYDNFITWPSSVTLTYLTNVSNCTSTPQGEQLCQISLKSMHKYRSYGPDKLNLWPFYQVTYKCDLDLQPTWTNVSNGSSTSQEEQLCKIILKSMHKYTSYGPDWLNLWPFYHLPFKCELDCQCT